MKIKRFNESLTTSNDLESSINYNECEECLTVSQLESAMGRRSTSVYAFYDFINEEMNKDKKSTLQKDFLKALEDSDIKLSQYGVMKSVQSMYEEEIEELEEEMEKLEDKLDTSKDKEKIQKELEDLEEKKDELEKKSKFDANDAGSILVDLLDAKKIKFKSLKNKAEFGDSYPYYYVGNDEDKKDPEDFKNRKAKPQIVKVYRGGKPPKPAKPSKPRVKRIKKEKSE